MDVTTRFINILKEYLTVRDGILLVTGGVLLWYTIETRRLRIVSGKQLKIDIRPVMVAIERSNSLTLKNIGRSPALNVTVKDVLRHDEMCFKFGKRTSGLLVKCYPFQSLHTREMSQLRHLVRRRRPRAATCHAGTLLTRMN